RSAPLESQDRPEVPRRPPRCPSPVPPAGLSHIGGAFRRSRRHLRRTGLPRYRRGGCAPSHRGRVLSPYPPPPPESRPPERGLRCGYVWSGAPMKPSAPPFAHRGILPFRSGLKIGSAPLLLNPSKISSPGRVHCRRIRMTAVQNRKPLK